MPKSTPPSGKRKGDKPAKPRPDFPIYPHAVGKWAKTIRGHTYCYGVRSDPEGALDEYLDQKDDLYAGRTRADHHAGRRYPTRLSGMRTPLPYFYPERRKTLAMLPLPEGFFRF